MSDRPGEMDERDVDERFASIVAAWGEPSPATDSDTDTDSGTDADDSVADRASSSTSTDDAPTARPSWVNPSPVDGLVMGSSWRVVEPPPPADATSTSDDAAPPAPAADDDEHFEPPTVELPPQEDLHFWGAVVGLVAGPLCLVYVAMARPFHSTRWFLAGLALSLVGFALLVLRQPRDRDTDDDGARV